MGAGDQVHIGDVGFRLEVRVPEKKAAPVAHAAKKAPAAPAAKAANVKQSPGMPNRRGDPKFLSQDLPVAIEDEVEEFVVEETQRKVKPANKIKPAKQKRPKEEEIIELDDIDIIED